MAGQEAGIWAMYGVHSARRKQALQTAARNNLLAFSNTLNKQIAGKEYIVVYAAVLDSLA
jgi:hypothetical protein